MRPAFLQVENSAEPLAKCWSPGAVRSPDPSWAPPALGLATDSSRTKWIGAEGGIPGKIWAATLTIYPPQGGTLGTFVQ